MPLFDTHIIVDWSARSKPSPKKPGKDAIWWAVARDGMVAEPWYERTRHNAIVRLADLIQAEREENRRVLVGFDFPFGYPAGVAQRLAKSASAFALWNWLAAQIDDGESNDNNRYEVATKINKHYPGLGPCWGRPSSWDYPDVPIGGSERDLQHTHPQERRIADGHAKGAKTVWQLLYTGSVGSQALLGIPALERLRHWPGLRGQVAVWPFDSDLAVPDKPVVLAEVYPSLLRDAIKVHARPDEVPDHAQVRINAHAFASLDTANELDPLFSGARYLSPDQRKQVVAEEGWILGLGHEAKLRAAAETGPAQLAGTSPPQPAPNADPSHDAGKSFFGCLRGTVIRYDAPFEPAARDTDWSALGGTDGRP